MYLLAEALPFIRRWRLLRRPPLNRDQVVLLMTSLNLILLGLDTYLAHSISGTIRMGEWIPIIFGPAAGILLLLAGLIAMRNRPAANITASIVCLSSAAVGLLGSYYHLHRAILTTAPVGQQITALVLVYAPPLLGPLTFALVGILGISAAWEEDPVDSGVLRLFGRLRLQMPLPKTRAYFLLTALFILATVLSSILDHARTNFVNPWLWLPTVVGIFATFITVAMGAYAYVNRGDILTYLVTMGLMILVGLIGAVLHVLHDLTGQGVLLTERAIRGAPLMAPLLFANMGALGLLILLHPKPEQET
jgi:hypothetical protein